MEFYLVKEKRNKMLTDTGYIIFEDCPLTLNFVTDCENGHSLKERYEEPKGNCFQEGLVNLLCKNILSGQDSSVPKRYTFLYLWALYYVTKRIQ